MLQLIQKYVNSIFKGNTLNAILSSSTDLLNIDNLKVAITQICNELQACNFTIFLLVFELQVILLIMEVTEK